MMKKIKNIIVFTFIIILFTSQYGFGQATAPNDPGGSPEAGTPLGGGAPVGNGLYVLLFLGTAYGAYKLYGRSSEITAEEE